MVSLKTKDVPPKRTFIIALSILGVGALAFSFSTLIASPELIPLVKNDVSVASVVDTEEEGFVAEQLAPQDDKPVITTYVVKSGDTLSSISSSFSISTNTVLWANDLTRKSVLKVGQKLTILPVSGVVYVVGKGDTLGGIAQKFDVSIEEIISFNDLEDTKVIRSGMKLIVPNAELPLEKPVDLPAQTGKKVVSKPVVKEAPKLVPTAVETKKEDSVIPAVALSATATDVDASVKTVVETETVSTGYFTHPIPGSVLTQGAHGYNSVDFGAPTGTSVLASASGTVIISKPSGYNGGYGQYVVIEHDNGTQTLYAHLSKVLVTVGDSVAKGQKIALSGNTGRSTGPHLHFEVRGGVNPWVGLKKFTKF
jgi:murein DD-endopeptidase MepM/ murein hydrolase activator NlpD